MKQVKKDLYSRDLEKARDFEVDLWIKGKFNHASLTNFNEATKINFYFTWLELDKMPRQKWNNTRK